MLERVTTKEAGKSRNFDLPQNSGITNETTDLNRSLLVKNNEEPEPKHCSVDDVALNLEL